MTEDKPKEYKTKISDYKEKENKVYLDATVISVEPIRHVDKGNFDVQNVQCKDKEEREFELQCYDGHAILTKDHEGKEIKIKNVYWGRSYQDKPIITTGRFVLEYGSKVELVKQEEK